MNATAAAAQATDTSKASDPYTAAAQASGVPLELIVAIAGAESGYHPWALDFGGRQVYCQSREEAEQMLDDADADNVDIGIMQVNWRTWGAQLGLTKRQLLDPRNNLLAGAWILRQCLERDGGLWERIGSYHSSTPDERDRYNVQVYRAYVRYRNSAR